LNIVLIDIYNIILLMQTSTKLQQKSMGYKLAAYNASKKAQQAKSTEKEEKQKAKAFNNIAKSYKAASNATKK
jgi:hypothetical protein